MNKNQESGIKKLKFKFAPKNPWNNEINLLRLVKV